jgi:hypothetical protein
MTSFRRGLTLGALVVCPLAWLVISSCGNGAKPPLIGAVDTGTLPPSDGATGPDGAPLQDGGGSDGATKDGAGGDGAGGDGAGGDGAPGNCNALAAAGPILNETVVAGPQPTPAGGQIFPGEYWLTERDFYPEATDPPDAGSSRANIVVQSSYFLGATSIDIVEGQGPLGATSVVTAPTSGTYKIGSATVFSIDQTCPGAERTNLPFTVSGDELWVFPSRDRRDVYTSQ